MLSAPRPYLFKTTRTSDWLNSERGTGRRPDVGPQPGAKNAVTSVSEESFLIWGVAPLLLR
jgi:hypothetical protein